MPVTDPITSIGNALTGFFGTIQPVIDEHYAQKYENEHRDRMVEFEGILSQPDSEDRADHLARFVERMCIAAGTPTGDLSGGQIRIPLSHFRTLVILASENIRDDRRIARLQFKGIQQQ